MKILVTGGAGYIGSTVVSALEDAGHTPLILDSLVKGREEFTRGKLFYRGDISDRHLLDKVFGDHPDIDITIHCAAHIIVPESVQDPYKYYHENVHKSVELLHHLIRQNKKQIIFSSSASIYLPDKDFIAREDSQIQAESPYAFSKIVIEQAMKDFAAAYGLRVISLRYFNPVGTDPKLRSGPYDKNPSHLLGSLIETAAGRRPLFEINGVNWATRDGSAIRDYIHVWDLAAAHVRAVECFDAVSEDGGAKAGSYSVINLGSEKGTTVKEFVHAFEDVIGRKLEKRETPPRPGDSIGVYASSERAQALLGWKGRLTIKESIEHALQWNEKRRQILGY